MSARGKVLTISTLLVQMLFSQFQKLIELIWKINDARQLLQNNYIITDLLLEKGFFSKLFN